VRTCNASWCAVDTSVTGEISSTLQNVRAPSGRLVRVIKVCRINFVVSSELAARALAHGPEHRYHIYEPLKDGMDQERDSTR